MGLQGSHQGAEENGEEEENAAPNDLNCMSTHCIFRDPAHLNTPRYPRRPPRKYLYREPL